VLGGMGKEEECTEKFEGREGGGGWGGSAGIIKKRDGEGGTSKKGEKLRKRQKYRQGGRHRDRDKRQRQRQRQRRYGDGDGD